MVQQSFSSTIILAVAADAEDPQLADV